MIRKTTIMTLVAASLAPGFAVASCDAVVCARVASTTPEFAAPPEAGDGTVTAIPIARNSAVAARAAAGSSATSKTRPAGKSPVRSRRTSRTGARPT